MEAYTSFAQVYDLFMDNVPYDAWCTQTVRILKDHGITDGIVADLGCGTGNLTERLADKGFDMIGIDLSEDMLEIAMEKKLSSGKNILYLCQDMRSFELYGTCRAIVSRCDAINYILSTEDLVSVFRLVNNYLDPEGVFVFDCNTVHKYETVLAENTIAENRSIGSFIWENSYDPESRINEYDLTLYIRDDQVDAPADENKECAGASETGNTRVTRARDCTAHEMEPRFRRFAETHFQRAFTQEELKAAAREAGLLWLDCMDAETMVMPDANTERLLIVLGENGKKKDET